MSADSAAARSAHLELAMRLVKAATQSSLWSRPSLGEATPTPIARPHNDNSNVGSALHDAFPLPALDPFQQLLDAVDQETDR